MVLDAVSGATLIGLGALLAGVGSVLSGWAALRAAGIKRDAANPVSGGEPRPRRFRWVPGLSGAQSGGIESTTDDDHSERSDGSSG